MGYEEESGTALLATSCIYCGKPLRDPASTERGCGPSCANNWGVFDQSGPVNEAALQSALDGAPKQLAEAVEKKMPDARAALSVAIHVTGIAWEQQHSDWQHYIGSMMELAPALGYPGTARAFEKIFIEGQKYDEDGVAQGKAKPKGILVREEAPGQWSLALPYLSRAVFMDTRRALSSAGTRSGPPDWNHHFRSDRWPYILNALVSTLSGTLGILPTGEAFIVPNEPVAIPDPAPAPDGHVSQDTYQDKQVPAPEVKKGDRVVLKNGEEVIVKWISGGGDRIGVVPGDRPEQRGNYVFLGTTEVATVKAGAAEQQAVEEQTNRRLPASVQNREVPSNFFPYQTEGVLWLEQLGSGIVAFEQGLGKTPTALVAADAPVVVICPASLRVNWARECARWRPDLTVAVVGVGSVSGAKSAKSSSMTKEQESCDVVILSYEGLVKNLGALQARGVNTLIMDEAQALKELVLRNKKIDGVWKQIPSGPKRAVAAWELSQNARRRIPLTGTPMVNGRPYELWPLLHLVDPQEWRNQKSFWKQYCDYHQKYIGGGRSVWDKSGSMNLSELRDKIHGQYLLRKTKQELPLPEKWRQRKEITLEARSAKNYADAAQDFLHWVRSTRGKEASEKASKAEVITRLTALRRLAALGKVPGIVEEVVSFRESTGRPLVLMGHHREVLTSIESALRELGLSVGTVMGDDSPGKRQADIDRFQTGVPATAPADQREYHDVLVCSISAAGVGLTLTRAQDMYMIERVWRPFDSIQAEDRIHRIGQENKVTIVYFDAPGTIDEMLAEVMDRKMETAGFVIDRAALESVSEESVAMEVFDSMMESVPAKKRGGYKRNQSADEDLPNWADPQT